MNPNRERPTIATTSTSRANHEGRKSNLAATDMFTPSVPFFEIHPQGCAQPPDRIVGEHEEGGELSQGQAHAALAGHHRKDIEELESGRGQTEDDAPAEHPNPESRPPRGQDEDQSPEPAPNQT